MAINKIPEAQLPTRSVSDTDYVRVVGADGKSYRVPKTDFNGGGGGGTIDPALSPTSTNPVQNKAIYNALSGLNSDIGDLDNLTTTAKNNLVAAINEAAQSGGGGGSSPSPYTSNPAALGTASPGSSSDYARGDHVHPKPTASDLGISVPDAATATPSNLGTAAVGSSSKYAKEDHVHNMPTAANVGAIASPSSPSSGQFLSYNGSAWAATDLPVNPDAKTNDMTQSVGVDSNGKLWTASGGSGGGLTLLKTITTTESVANVYQTFTACKRVVLELTALSQDNTSTSAVVLWVTLNKNGYQASKAFSLHQLTGGAGVVFGTQYQCKAVVDMSVISDLVSVEYYGRYGSGNGFLYGDVLNTSDVGSTISSVYMYLPSVNIATGFKINIYGELA